MRLKRKSQEKGIDKKLLGKIIEQELSAYVTREELREYFENIEKDKRKKELWDSLPARKKAKVLRYVLEKGAKNGKK